MLIKNAELSQKSTKKGRINTFDAVRAVAIIAVFLFHAGYLISYPDTHIIDWVHVVNIGGTVGVMIFFVLSGFLLFYQLYKDHEGLDKQRLKDYTKKRLIRIFPLYYISLFLIVFTWRHQLLLSADGIRAIIYNVFFVRGLKSATGGGSLTINPVYWTLVVEMHFYILLPIFYAIWYRSKKIWLFLAFATLGIGYRLALITLLHHPTNQLMRLTPSNFDFFAFGMLGGYLYVDKKQWASWLGKIWVQLSLLSIGVLFVYFYDLTFAPTISYLFAPTIFGALAAMIIFSFLCNEQSFLVKIFSVRPVRFIAKISYSIYIWHAIVIDVIEHTALQSSTKFGLDIVLTVFVSTASYYVIERPFLRYQEKKRLLAHS